MDFGPWGRRRLRRRRRRHWASSRACNPPEPPRHENVTMPCQVAPEGSASIFFCLKNYPGKAT
eukprot:8577594-Pyramimonas_sp.AAC.1